MSCPECRGGIGNEVVVGVLTGVLGLQNKPRTQPRLDPETVSTSASAVALEETGATLGQLSLEEIRSRYSSNTPTGIAGAVSGVLISIKNARSPSDGSHDTLLIMAICPGVDVGDGVLGGLEFDVMHYRTIGTTRERMTKEKLDA